MTSALTHTDSSPDTETPSRRRCDCRTTHHGEVTHDCPNSAAWIYRMKCCSGSTFVCNTCRDFHIVCAQFVFRCRICHVYGTIPSLVGEVVKLS